MIDDFLLMLHLSSYNAYHIVYLKRIAWVNSMNGPLMGGGGGPGLVYILRMVACPVSLAQSLCQCVTHEGTRNLVNYAVTIIFH